MRVTRSRLLAVGLSAMICACLVIMWTRWRPAPAESPVKVLSPRANAISCSPDRGTKFVAAAMSDGRVRLWETATRNELPVKLPSQWPLNDMAWSSDGTALFVGGFEQHVLSWNIKSKQGRKLPMFAAPIVSLAIRPQRMELLVSLSNGELWWSHLQSGEREAIATGHRGVVKMVRYHPDGQTFVTAGADQQLVWHDAERRAVTNTVAAHQHEISSLAFTKDGSRLVTGSWDSTAKIWKSGAAEPDAVLVHPEGVFSVAWQGDAVVSTCWDHQLRLWNVATSSITKQRVCQSESLSFAVWPGHSEVAEIDSSAALRLTNP